MSQAAESMISSEDRDELERAQQKLAKRAAKMEKQRLLKEKNKLANMAEDQLLN